MTEALNITDQAAAAVAVAPRVALSDIECAIGEIHYTTANEALGLTSPVLGLLTVCFVVMRNGFVVIGKSAPASPDNFNADLGRKFAYEDAIRQIWPLMGFALKDRLAGFS